MESHILEIMPTLSVKLFLEVWDVFIEEMLTFVASATLLRKNLGCLKYANLTQTLSGVLEEIQPNVEYNSKQLVMEACKIQNRI